MLTPGSGMIIKDEGFRASADSELLVHQFESHEKGEDKPTFGMNELFSPNRDKLNSKKKDNKRSKNDTELRGWPSQADSENTINFDSVHKDVQMIRPMPPRVVAHPKKEEQQRSGSYYQMV